MVCTPVHFMKNNYSFMFFRIGNMRMDVNLIIVPVVLSCTEVGTMHDKPFMHHYLSSLRSTIYSRYFMMYHYCTQDHHCWINNASITGSDSVDRIGGDGLSHQNPCMVIPLSEKTDLRPACHGTAPPPACCGSALPPQHLRRERRR